MWPNIYVRTISCHGYLSRHQSSSQISLPMHVSSVDITASPNGTFNWIQQQYNVSYCVHCIKNYDELIETIIFYTNETRAGRNRVMLPK